MTGPFLSGPNNEDLLENINHAIRANPRNYERVRADDSSLFEDLFTGSPLLDFLRQQLPEKFGQTSAGRRVDALFPDQVTPKTLTDYIQRGIANVPLGGYPKEYKEEFAQARLEDPKLQRDTVQAGMVPVPGGGERPASGFRDYASQAAGVAGADLVSDGLRNIWWFLNAPQAIATLAVLNAVQEGGKDFKDPTEKGPLLRNRNLRMATAVPAWIAASMAVGNFGRQPGYKAAVPSEADPSITADPLAELGTRFFLGRTGGLLPYEDFVKERPDVSRGEYEAYKAYLFSSSSPIKATLDGIHGPEVTFLGKSVPVATGIVPLAAGVLGAGFGMRRAGRQLADEGRLSQLGKLRNDLEEASKNLYRVKGDRKATPEAIEGAELNRQAAETRVDRIQSKIDAELLKQTLLYSSLGLAGAGLAGGTLESMRRALKGRAEVEPDPATTTLPVVA